MSDNKAAVDAIDTTDTVWALKTAVSQIDMSLHCSEDSVAKLIEAITEATDQVRTAKHEALRFGVSDSPAKMANIISAQCEEVEASLHKAIMALQFYDRMTQRLLHIQENLCAVSAVMLAPEQKHSSLFKSLHGKMGSVYSPEQEQLICESLLQELAAEKHHKNPVNENTQTSNDIELF